MTNRGWGRVLFLILLSGILAGCAGQSKSVGTETHKFLEHAGIDWFNF